jgi:nucleoside-diphosphate-sugar epimerase
MRSHRAAGKVFNVGTHRAHSVLDIFNLLKKILSQPHAQARFLPKRPGDVRRSLADVTLAKRVLGFQAHMAFDEGLEKTVQWFLDHRSR